MKPITKILVPTDFSPDAEPAIERALDLARSFSASVMLFHVYELPIAFPEGYSFTAELITAIEKEAHAKLAETIERLRQRTQVPISGKVGAGATAMAIVDEAAQGGFDLIVMGTHGRTGFSRFFIGSVAERVVRLATCPVLTIRNQKAG